MSLSPLDPSTVRAAAQAALDDRLGLIDTIVAAQNERTVASTKVAEAEAAERAAASKELAAIKAALDGGWSSTELRAAGLKVPQSINKKSTNAQGSARNSARTTRPRPPVTAQQSESGTSDVERQPAPQREPGDSYANAS
ncbi:MULTISPECIES: hypothetical protein [Nocardiaceae]|uniref:hypothetical protein n=1 Tax=Nocardiaceae TaxID=85025 RepID=UPI00055A509F|nr:MULTISPECIES: hypothetical protein [Rhodococcus]OZD12068.1 hypothetical protein CH248_29140 [Rhodococcus sp. 06-156-4a]OZD15737.1 hypothetical protein CH253_22480 [Rhodococcus sp. 06-156-3C]OZD21121.1 hypothetical protein CH280_02710 [Rhodococcus sp. 06-156-4C]OZD32304.1 hypothetical protein CH284_20640 [Rhodococcus sp. 06-156-3]OZD36525.1 hypothetical protein CH247_03065 [Rhodococcus sp. 06-156-3b]